MSYIVEAGLKAIADRRAIRRTQLNAGTTSTPPISNGSMAAEPKRADNNLSLSTIIIAFFAPVPITIIAGIIITGIMQIDFAAFAAVFPPTFIIFEVFFTAMFISGFLSAASKQSYNSDVTSYLVIFTAIRSVMIGLIYLQVIFSIWVMKVIAFGNSDAINTQIEALGTATQANVGLIGGGAILTTIIARIIEHIIPKPAVKIHINNKPQF